MIHPSLIRKYCCLKNSTLCLSVEWSYNYKCCYCRPGKHHDSPRWKEVVLYLQYFLDLYMIISGNTLYYMATIVCALWLAAKRALFSFNDWALLARCSRHIQSVFNLIVDILMDFHVDWSIDSCQKGCPLTSVTWLYWGLKCTTYWGDVFF